MFLVSELFTSFVILCKVDICKYSESVCQNKYNLPYLIFFLSLFSKERQSYFTQVS